MNLKLRIGWNSDDKSEIELDSSGDDSSDDEYMYRNQILLSVCACAYHGMHLSSFKKIKIKIKHLYAWYMGTNVGFFFFFFNIPHGVVIYSSYTKNHRDMACIAAILRIFYP